MHNTKDILVIDEGQLGMFTARAGEKTGDRVTIWLESPKAPAARTKAEKIVAPYAAREIAGTFGKKLPKAVTYAFENIPLSILTTFEGMGIPVHPSSNVLHIAQDRAREKQCFDRLGLQIPQTIANEKWSESSIDEEDRFAFPGILKTRRFGYDGKGQTTVNSAAELSRAWEKLGKAPCVLEQKIDFDFEVSVIVARSKDGSITATPPIENRHEGGILRESWCPGPHVTPAIADKALEAAQRIAHSLMVVGLVAVEMFVKGGDVIINEIAPRPHNSGHGTIDACETSQFEQLLHAVAGRTLRPFTPHHGWHMRNLIGNDILAAHELRERGYIVYEYGKSEIREGRKMGHATKLLGPWR